MLMSAVVRIRQGLERRADAIVARTRRRVLPFRIRHLAGPRTVSSSPTSLVVVCMVRDGAAHLDGFVHHYRRLGAAHIVFLDNGSRDGTVQRAAAFDDVTVLQTLAPFRTYKRAAKRYLVEQYGKSGWVLCVDIDELFDYPYRERVPLNKFLGYLHSRGFSAVVAYLLDLFPRGALLKTAVEREQHRYYDINDVEREPYPYDETDCDRRACASTPLSLYSGGIRKRAFGAHVNLTKRPLLYPPAGPVLMTSHRIRGGEVADVTAVLRHYKYVGPFHALAKRAVLERSYYRDSEEYRQYIRAFARKPGLELFSANSREFRHVDQLIDEGFLVVSPAYRRLAGLA
jgi:hypothetical protein